MVTRFGGSTKVLPFLDEKLIKRCEKSADKVSLRNFESEMRREKRRARERLSIAKDMATVRPLDEQKAQTVSKKWTTKFERALRSKPPGLKPRTSHNPVFYPPYDGRTWSQHREGVTTVTQHGFSSGNGRAGFTLSARDPYGSIGRRSNMSFWFYTMSDGTLRASVQASVWGVGSAFSLGGWASAQAWLGIEIMRPTNNNNMALHAEHRAPIFDVNSILMYFDLDNTDARQYDSVSTFFDFPVRAFTPYRLSAGNWQTATAIGLSALFCGATNKCDMYIGSIDLGFR